MQNSFGQAQRKRIVFSYPFKCSAADKQSIEFNSELFRNSIEIFGKSLRTNRVIDR